jgi:hypothetical protein
MINNFFLTIFVFSLPAISFSQMRIGEIIKIYKMNRSQFENYVQANGYSFVENQHTDRLRGVRYKKGIAENTKFLMFQDKFYDFGNCVNYQTWSTLEYESIIHEINRYGFAYFDTKQFHSKDGSIKNRESYRNNNFELSIFITPNHNEGYNRYEISLIKFR